MSGSADILRIVERYDGRFGPLPDRGAPRLVLIHNFSAGRAGWNSPRNSGINNLANLMREYSGRNADVGIAFLNVYLRSGVGNTYPTGIEPVRVVAGDAVRAQSAIINNGAGTPVPQFRFRAYHGADYNDLTVTLTRTHTIATGHPAGANTSVYTVVIQNPNRSIADEVFEDVVFTRDGGKGTYLPFRTTDAADLRSAVGQFVYETTADGTYNAVSATLTLTGGSDGTLVDADWQAAIDEVSGVGFRIFAMPDAPSEAVRSYYVAELRAGAPFGLVCVSQMYGESDLQMLAARDTYGNGVESGKLMTFFGFGQHPASMGFEVPFMAGYLGRWNAKMNAAGLGSEYTVGNTDLGYSNISPLDRLTRAQQEDFAAANINYAKRFDNGSYGVHGFWTLDSRLDRDGDASVRVMRNEILYRVASAFTQYAQNRGNTPSTRAEIAMIGNKAIENYIQLGYVAYAATGVFDLEEVQARFSELGLPQIPGWVYWVASLRFNPTMGGVIIYLTDVEIATLGALTASVTTEPQEEVV